MVLVLMGSTQQIFIDLVVVTDYFHETHTHIHNWNVNLSLQRLFVGQSCRQCRKGRSRRNTEP